MAVEQNKPSDLQAQDEAFVSEYEQQILDNQAVIEQYNAKYQQPRNEHPEWQFLGAVESYTHDDNRLLLTCENGYVQMTWLAPQTVHVRVQPDSDDFSDYFSYYVADFEPHTVDLRLRDKSPYASEAVDTLFVETDTHTYRINQAQFSLSVDTRYGRPIYSENSSVSWAESGESRLQVGLHSDEACFGTGERAFDLNLRGRKLSFWNTDPGGYQRGDDPVNYHVSFYLGVHEAGIYGLLWDNPARGVFDIGAANPDELSITAEVGDISYYLFMGEDVNSVMHAYTHVTGRMPLPPIWALGYHQSRYSYMNHDDLISTAKEFRERKIPCDVMYLDIHYMDDYKIFTWNQEAFPNMRATVDALHEMGMKLVVIMDPGVKAEAGYAGYDSGVKQGIFLRYPDEEFAAGVVWPGLCHFPDFSNPDGRAWWGEQLNDLLSKGIDGIWNDMNEPLMFQHDDKPAALPDYVVHDKEGRNGTHLELHNTYGMQMGRASMDALEQHRAGKRQFTIIRAGAAGAQRYSASWTGDNYSTWDDLRVSISMTLQMGLSGVPFTGADIGGFNYDATGELLTRWTQAGALMPLFRNHSAVTCIRQEPWRFGDEYEQATADAIRLRYRLLPYLYSTFAECSTYGYPIVRPVFMAEPDNPHLRTTDDCYLLGDKLLVAPVMTQGALRRTVYLPDGMWYDFNTHERYEGGKLISVEAPLNTLPLFIKSGSVIPMWDVIQTTDDAAVNKLILRTYTDTGETRIYEDAGEGNAHLEGEYRWITYTCVESTESLMIERHVEGDYTPSYTRIELQLVGASQQIGTVEVNGDAIDDWHFSDGIVYANVPIDFETIRIAI